jgi:hypothetical protein
MYTSEYYLRMKAYMHFVDIYIRIFIVKANILE